MSIVVPGIPTSAGAILQDRTLERVFHDSLFPRQLFRGEAKPESWASNLGEQMTYTRRGLMAPKLRPLQPGKDPVPNSYQVEQWSVEAAQYADTIDTHIPTSNVTIASTFLSDAQALGLNAAMTMDRLTRAKLFTAYLSGEAMSSAQAAIATKDVQVSTLNGFTERVNGGRLMPVSTTNPMPVTFSNGEAANEVVGFVPMSILNPLGPGVLTLKNALVANLPARTAILASTRARRLRAGGGATVDAITSTSVLTLNDIIAGATRMRENLVPVHPDGYYHVHLTPTGEQQLFADPHWQRLHEGVPDSMAYANLAIGKAVGCIFYRNTECPTLQNTGDHAAIAGGAGGAQLAYEIGGEVTNANGVEIRRAIMTGGGALYEKYIDESKYITEAGVQGKIGEFSIVNGGLQIMTARVRYILKAPSDRLMQVVQQTWSWSGDFGIPSDLLIGDSARYKRALVLEHV